MIGEISALASALAIAGSAVLSKSLLARIAALPLQTLRTWFAALLLLTLSVLLGRAGELTNLSWILIGLMTLSSFIGIGLGDTLYLRTLTLVDVSKAFPVVRGTQILTAILIALFLFDEQVTWTLSVGTILILSGVYLAAFSGAEAGAEAEVKKDPGAPLARRKAWLPLAIVVGFCWALSWCIMKVVLMEIDPLTANIFRLPVASLILTLIVLGAGQGQSLRFMRHGTRVSWLIVLSGILGYALGAMLALYALHYAGVSRTAVLTSVTPLFVLSLSILFLKEKLTLRLGMGTLLCAVGIAIIMVG